MEKKILKIKKIFISIVCSLSIVLTTKNMDYTWSLKNIWVIEKHLTVHVFTFEHQMSIKRGNPKRPWISKEYIYNQYILSFKKKMLYIIYFRIAIRRIS